MIDSKRCACRAGVFIIVIAGLLMPGCGVIDPRSELETKVDDVFDKTGLLKGKSVEALIKLEGSTLEEKIDALMSVINDPDATMRHAAAAEAIVKMNDPYRVNALIAIIDTYAGPQSVMVDVRNQALMGLGNSLDLRAFERMYKVLDEADDDVLLQSVLHKLGVAAFNADQNGVEMSKEFYREIGEQIRRMRQHENTAVREHANRAYDRWKRRVAM